MDKLTAERLTNYLDEEYGAFKASLVNFNEIEILNIYKGIIEMRIIYDTDIEEFCLKYINTDDCGMPFDFIEYIISFLKEIENEQRSENIKTN